ncbi:uncharacterized protein IUM83_01015 [Phytophthora cinnamomi]|uniref:uncharacterized protein n=1 Tax=Phytophthora cinnamomi TaxID=4785 RepID=UPI00355A9CC9|nr:hypothetical protein IUM83_01015 [Phytophthora cinnamomi]
MDLVLLDGDSEDVVSAAMALIDSAEERASTDNDPTAESSDDNSSVGDDKPLIRSTKTAPEKPKRKRKYKPGYSTEQSRRKKAEVLALRSQMQGLEEWIVHLKRRKSNEMKGEIVSPRQTSSQALVNQSLKAMEEFHKRQQSEAVNYQLKTVLARQAALGKSILAVIQQTSALKDKEVVFSWPRQLAGSFDNAAVIGQLRSGAGMLYQEMNSVVPTRPGTIYSSEMVPKVDPKRGKMFECSTFFTVPCSMKSAGDALWFEYSTPRKYENKSYRFMNRIGPNAVKKNFDLLLNSKRGAISMNGLMFANRFEASDRISMVRDYIAFLPTAGLHMRCHHWTLLTPAKDGQECHVQFFFQIYMEKSAFDFSAAQSDVEYVQDVALAAWCAKMHLYSHILHEKLEQPQM